MDTDDRRAAGKISCHCPAKPGEDCPLTSDQCTRRFNEHRAWSALVTATREWANHMDQWEKFRFATDYGPVYVSIMRETEHPDSFDWVTP